jgi:outer membrane immunogenic protein
MGDVMKRISLGVVAAIVLAAPAARAADMTVKAPPAPPACAWCGFYIGADAGGGWVGQSGTTIAVPAGFGAPAIPGAGFAGIGILPTFHSLDRSGGLGGVHAGYNWQVSKWLFGVEGDWMWLNGSTSNAQTTLDTFGATRPDGSMLISANANWLASIRGRIGVVATPQWMYYFTGGAAFTDRSTTATWTPLAGALGPPPTASTVSFDGTKTGFVLGAGVEWMVAPHWIVRGEYLYYGFNGGSGALPFVVPAGNGCTPTGTCGWNVNTSNLQISTVRAGLSYKF